MTLDMSIIEVVDVDSGSIEWVGPVEEFIEANDMDEFEIAELFRAGYVVTGGGASPVVTVRFGLKEAVQS